MPRGRKLYFNVVLTELAPTAIVALTEVTAGAPGDRNGAFLDRLPALDGNASAAAKARQEVTAIFVPYHQTAGGGGGDFLFVDAISGDQGSQTFFPNGTGFQGPLILNFTQDVDPASVELGTTVLIFQSNEGQYNFELEVVDNTILVHLLEGMPGSEVSDDWVDLGTEISIELTPALEDTPAGNALGNPGVIGAWEWTNV